MKIELLLTPPSHTFFSAKRDGSFVEAPWNHDNSHQHAPNLPNGH